MTVAGGTPSIPLNDGGTATYQSGSGSSALVFTYTVGALGSGENTPDLALAATNALSLNGATITGATGNAADLSGADGYNPAGTLQIDTTAPTLSSITAVTDNGLKDLNAGRVVTITVGTSEVVNVSGIPTLQLNDNEVATYTGGTGTNTLTFAYTVKTRRYLCGPSGYRAQSPERGDYARWGRQQCFRLRGQGLGATN